MKLVVKYNWYTVSMMILVFIISGTGSYFLIKKALTNELDISLIRVQSRIQKYVDKNNNLPLISTFDDERIIFEPSPYLLHNQQLYTVQQFIKEQQKLHVSRSLVYGLKVKARFYKVTITSPLEGTRHLLLAMLAITTMTIIFLITFILLTNRMVMKRLWAPFYQAIDQLHHFNISNFKQLNFPDTNIQEFRFLIENLELTTTKAVENYRILKEFTENASHEFQTPLAIMRSQLDLLIQGDSLNAGQSEHLIIAYQALTRLSRLNQSLLLIAKIDNLQFHQITHIDLQSKVKDKIKDFGELWTSKKIDVDADLSEAYIDASTELIDIMLNNLFSNSCKHNLVHGTTHIRLRSGNLKIINTGKTEPLDPGRIFTRFYRTEPEASSNGLGLSIIKKICDQTGIEPVYQFDHEKGEHSFTLVW